MQSPPVTELITRTRAALRNWYWLAPLAWLALPSRLPPHSGLLDTSLGRTSVRLQLRNGTTLVCRLNEIEGFFSAFVARDYAPPGVHLREARTVVDVGANVGAAALWFATEAPNARIVALEPASETYPVLCANVAANRLARRVHPRQIALGGSNRTAFVEPGIYSLSTRVSSDARAGGRPVEQLSLDALMEQEHITAIDVLKLDCEGAEYDILLGASDAALRQVRAIVGEHHAVNGHAPWQIEERLRAAGFEVCIDDNPGLGMFSASRKWQPAAVRC
ncbi:MAG: FkbM family methyltransferase [Candidatus Dormibacteraeota bacterium]|nr:FkbM family methyltransferase [Candidatus Dormibacteraeota bacterium]